MKRIFFWGPEPNLHIRPLLAAVRERNVEVIEVYDQGVSSERQALGWDPAQAEDPEITPDPSRRRVLETSARRADANIFVGWGVYPGVTQSMRALANSPTRTTRILVLSEPWDVRGIPGVLREPRFNRRIRALGSSIDGVLAVGELARKQFAAAGYPTERIFDFAYYLSATIRPRQSRVQDDGTLRVAFVGQLIKRKRPIDAINAVRSLDVPWTLNVVGSGPLRTKVANELRGLPARFTGPMSRDQVLRLLAESHILVLPSEFDGWGAVVNEALLHGCACVVSEGVESRQMLQSVDGGFVVRVGDVTGMTESIMRIDSRIRADPSWHQILADRAESSWGTAAGANRLISVIGSMGWRDV